MLSKEEEYFGKILCSDKVKNELFGNRYNHGLAKIKLCLQAGEHHTSGEA